MRTEKNIVTKANKRRKLDDNDVDWDVSQNHISDESVIQVSSTAYRVDHCATAPIQHSHLNPALATQRYAPDGFKPTKQR